MSQNLFFALAEEHKQRTGHDVFHQGPLDTTHITCEVCLFLTAEHRAYQDAERCYYEEQAELAAQHQGSQDDDE